MRQYHSSIYFSEIERVDLLKAWLAISVAFGIFFLSGEGFSKVTFSHFLFVVGIAAVTAGAGFIIHELCHKFTAHRFGIHSEFRSDDTMLVVTIFIAFLGIVFAAPGAVQIYSPVTRRENGIISVAGPLSNIALALLFLAGVLFLPHATFLYSVAAYGLFINAMLGAFNLIPLGNFDGAKVWQWSRSVFAGTASAAALLVVAAFILVPAF